MCLQIQALIVSDSETHQCLLGYLSIALKILQFIPSTRRNNETPLDAVKTVKTRHSGFPNFERILIMKSTTAATLVLALSSLVAGQAMAGNIDTSNPSELDFALNVATQPATASSKSRAEVRAELAQAKSSNIDTSNASELDFAFNAAGAQGAASTLTRAQVRAEAAQAKRSNIDLSNASELDFAFNANKATVAARADIAQAQVEPAPVEYAAK
jgi:hypothetical protein